MIPTSLRFKYAEDAKHWNTSTAVWHVITEIKRVGNKWYKIATVNFSWIYFDKSIENLEFNYNEDNIN